MNELSNEIFTHVAIVRKDKDEQIVVPITHETMVEIALASNAKKVHFMLNSNLYYIRDITIEVMSDQYKKKSASNVIRYTLDELIGKHRWSDKCIYKFTHMEESLRKKSLGGNIERILDVTFGFFIDGKINYVRKEDIIF